MNEQFDKVCKISLLRKVQTGIESGQNDENEQMCSIKNSGKRRCYKKSWQPYIFDDKDSKSIDQFLKIKVKKGIILKKGVYMLVKGKLSYFFSNKQTVSEKKETIHSFIKNYSPFLAHNNLLDFTPLPQQYGILLDHKNSTILSSGHNFITLQDSIFLQLTGHQAQFPTILTKQMQFIKDLITYSNFKSARNHDNNLFTLNLDLVNFYSLKKLSFNNTLCLSHSQIGIVNSGQLKVQNNSQGISLIQKYAIVLPLTTYRVNSAAAEILIISNNPTLKLTNKTQLTDAINKIYSQYYKKQNISVHTKKMTFLHKRYQKHEKGQKTVYRSKKYEQIHRKQLIQTSEFYKEFSIIPMNTCQANLQFSSKKLGQKKQFNGKYKSPRILFQYDNSRRNRNIPSLQSVFQNQTFSLQECNKKQNKDKAGKFSDYLSFFRPKIRQFQKSKFDQQQPIRILKTQIINKRIDRKTNIIASREHQTIQSKNKKSQSLKIFKVNNSQKQKRFVKIHPKTLHFSNM